MASRRAFNIHESFMFFIVGKGSSDYRNTLQSKKNHGFLLKGSLRNPKWVHYEKCVYSLEEIFQLPVVLWDNLCWNKKNTHWMFPELIIRLYNALRPITASVYLGTLCMLHWP